MAWAFGGSMLPLSVGVAEMYCAKFAAGMVAYFALAALSASAVAPDQMPARAARQPGPRTPRGGS